MISCILFNYSFGNFVDYLRLLYYGENGCSNLYNITLSHKLYLFCKLVFIKKLAQKEKENPQMP